MDANNNGHYEPFKATVLWKSMQEALRSDVPRTNKHLRNRKLADCFTGADAVSTLTQYLSTRRTELRMKEVTPHKLVKLCQIWLETGVFEAVGGSTERLPSSSTSKAYVFLNSHSAYYRFLEGNQSASISSLFRRTPSMRASASSAELEMHKKLKWNLTPDGARRKATKTGLLDAPLHDFKILDKSPKGRKKSFLSPVMGRSNKISSEDRSPSQRGFGSPMDSEDVFLPSSSSPRNTAHSEKSDWDSVIRTGKFALLSRNRSPKFDGVVAEMETKLEEKRKGVKLGRSESDYFSQILDANMSIASGSSFNDSELDCIDFDKIDEMLVHDSALFRLLTLVEIPVLDGILHIKNKVVDLGQETGGGLLDTLMAKLHLSSVSSASSDWLEVQTEVFGTKDDWMIRGIACIPRNMRVSVWEELKTVAEIRGLGGRKVFLFYKVCDLYLKLGHKDVSLIPTQYEDLVWAIIHQQINRSRPECVLTALDSCRMLIFMLPRDTRDTLSRLLHFMEAIWDDETPIEIDPNCSNFEYCVKTFSSVIMKRNSLDELSVWRFVEFLVHKLKYLFEFPNQLKRSIAQQLTHNAAESAGPGVTYCRQISKSEFEQQKMEKSEEALVRLAASVMDDTKMSLPAKTKYMEKFRLNYPELFHKHFPNIAW